ncbi:MAG: hypothetical protein REI11_19420 [Patulibacter sp.]|nr:hypothetical protein [Patulibacter sp.]
MLTVPYHGHLSMPARAAITAAVRQRTIQAHPDPLSSVLAIATDEHVSVFADAPPPVLARWLASDRLLAYVTEAILFVASEAQEASRERLRSKS